MSMDPRRVHVMQGSETHREEHESTVARHGMPRLHRGDAGVLPSHRAGTPSVVGRDGLRDETVCSP